MRIRLALLSSALALVTIPAAATADDEAPVRTFTPQLPVTVTAQPVEVTPAASSGDEFPTGAMTDTQTLALPMAADDDEK